MSSRAPSGVAVLALLGLAACTGAPGTPPPGQALGPTVVSTRVGAAVFDATGAPPIAVETPDEPAPRPAIRTPELDCSPIKEVGYRRGRRFPIMVVTIDDDMVERRTADAYWAMREAAAADGIELVIFSAFRTAAEQRYFYRCFRTCSCNACSPAARPGRSNHQSGRAIDIGLWPGVREWLGANAKRFGFVATVKSEPWHWEYRPRKRTRWPRICPR